MLSGSFILVWTYAPQPRGQTQISRARGRKVVFRHVIWIFVSKANHLADRRKWFEQDVLVTAIERFAHSTHYQHCCGTMTLLFLVEQKHLTPHRLGNIASWLACFKPTCAFSSKVIKPHLALCSLTEQHSHSLICSSTFFPC